MEQTDYEQFVEKYKHPAHRGKLKNAKSSEASNMPCGDNIAVYVSIDKSGKIVDAKHDGYGCALAVASADMLCDYLIGKKFDDACKTNFEMMTKIIGFTPTIGRVGCVGVSLDALLKICKLEKDKK